MKLSQSLKPLAIAGLLLAGSQSAALADNEVKAVATFSILGDMVANVGGARVQVTTLVGPDGDGHVYQPTPADAKSVTEADVVFINGLSFEGWIDRLVQSSGYSGPVVVATKGIVAREMGEEHGHEHGEEAKAEEHDHDHDHKEEAKAEAHDHDHEHKDEAKDHDHDHEKEEAGHHHHEGEDPHAWQSLANGLVYVKNIAEGLCAADPEGCDGYKKNAEAYSAEISKLDETIRAEIGKVAETKRRVITSHDAFGYFEQAYGVEFIAPQGVSTEAEASAADVAEIIRQIKNDKVTALFVENITDPRLVEQIARETGIKIGGSLYSDALSAESGPAGTYLKMFEHNADALAKAMLGS